MDSSIRARYVRECSSSPETREIKTNPAAQPVLALSLLMETIIIVPNIINYLKSMSRTIYDRRKSAACYSSAAIEAIEQFRVPMESDQLVNNPNSMICTLMIRRECSQDIPYLPKKRCQLNSEPIPCGAPQYHVNQYLLQYHTQLSLQSSDLISQDYADLENYSSHSPRSPTSRRQRISSATNNAALTSDFTIEVASSPEKARPAFGFLDRYQEEKSLTELRTIENDDVPVIQVSQGTIKRSRFLELVHFPYPVVESSFSEWTCFHEEDEEWIAEETPVIDVTPEMIAETRNTTLVTFPPIPAEVEIEVDHSPTVTKIPVWEREYDPFGWLELDLRKTALIPNLSW